jgi:hypothetical protein
MLPWLIAGIVVATIAAFKVLRHAEADDKRRKTVRRRPKATHDLS